MQQIGLADWPIGLERDVAYLSILPREIARRAGVRFETAEDALGMFEAAVVRDPIAGTFALQSHKDAPAAGTKLIAEDDGRRVLTAAVRELSLQRADFAWITPAAARFLDAALCQAKSGPAKVDIARSA